MWAFVDCHSLFLAHPTVSFQFQHCGLEFFVGVVEKQVGIEIVSFEVGLKVEMLCGGTPCAACESYHLTGLDVVAYLDKVFTLVAVERFEAEGVADDDAVAIAAIWAGAGHDPVESG